MLILRDDRHDLGHAGIRVRRGGGSKVTGLALATPQDGLQLTAAEKAWLAVHPVVTIVPDPYAKPTDLLDARGQHQGIAADYLARLEEILGLRFAVIQLQGWHEVLSMARSRVVDVVPAAPENPLRREHLLFTEPYLELQAIIITRENASDAILIMEEDQFIDCNPQTLELFACTRANIIGARTYEFSPLLQPDGHDSTEKARELISKAYAGEVQRFEWQYSQCGGTPFDCEVSLDRIEVDGQRRLQGSVLDITLWECSEEARHQAKDLVDVANRSKSEFLANMSYEIRTPLNCIIGMSELMLDMDLLAELRQYLGMIHSSGKALLNLISDILDLTKIEAGLIELECATFDLRQMLSTLVNLMTLQA